MVRVVVRDRRFRRGLGSHYIYDKKFDYPSIPDNIPLTLNVLRQYANEKSSVGYSPFRGLSDDDIVSILSAVKRQEAHVNVDRMGNCSYYKLHLWLHLRRSL